MFGVGCTAPHPRKTAPVHDVLRGLWAETLQGRFAGRAWGWATRCAARALGHHGVANLASQLRLAGKAHLAEPVCQLLSIELALPMQSKIKRW
jgi:hypothetical protein